MRRKASGKRAWKTNAVTENSISLTSKTTVFSGPASLGGLKGRSRERPFYFSPIGNVNLGFAAMNSLQAQSASTPRKRAGQFRHCSKKWARPAPCPFFQTSYAKCLLAFGGNELHFGEKILFAFYDVFDIGRRS